ncbi:MAG: SpoIID/LytB domain-containing protein [Bacteroidales bacterium]|jgi:stage II sporulation protein D|nr:SpoIID/LytB domain-containing protein [Bacteroidales bacterium]MCI1733743.1 SpoIID/LytB domain-containing protein [Bacteroidales bacterium]
MNSIQPFVSVGIMHADKIKFKLNGKYQLTSCKSSAAADAENNLCAHTDRIFSGEHTVELNNGRLLLDGEGCDEFILTPTEDSSEDEPKSELGTFWLYDVTIGVNFHWERKENEKFRGFLKFIVDEGKACAVNLIGIEDYLKSVISSEMNAAASGEFLKAHAVISRSWLMAQIAKRNNINSKTAPVNSFITTDKEIIKWYDREDHKKFDVCADDHCQRYEGLTRESTKTVADAVDATWGKVLSYKGEICDARFYKCCGGVLEEFENAWEPKHYDYLLNVRDNEDAAESERKGDFSAALSKTDLTKEENAEKWILDNPDSFCNTHDKKILSQVLNNYDQETVNFYRWKVEYSADEISAIAKKRSGIDFGTITDMIPVERGTSGRLTKLKIVGTKRTVTIGKELEIRKTLSESHLYSSAFIVRKYDASGKEIKNVSAEANGNGVARFELIGAGWGHGVGLCQIGAAVMGEKGYKYNEILRHYYPNSELIKKY